MHSSTALRWPQLCARAVKLAPARRAGVTGSVEGESGAATRRAARTPLQTSLDIRIVAPGETLSMQQ